MLLRVPATLVPPLLPRALSLLAGLAFAALAFAGCPSPTEPVPDPDPEPSTPRPTVVVGGLAGYLQDPTDAASRMTVRLRVLGADGPLVAQVTVGAEDYTTGADGTIDIPDLPTAGAVQARVTAPGYFAGTATLSFSALGGRPEIRLILRAADATTSFEAIDGGQLSYGAFSVAVPPGALRLPGARDEVYDGPADLGMDLVVSEGQLVDSEGGLKRRFDLNGLPVSSAGPFLARDEAGVLHNVVPLSATTVSMATPEGDELVTDPASPVSVGLTPNRLADGLNLTMQGGLFASSGDEVGSFIPCAPAQGEVIGCTTDRGGIAAVLGQIDAFVSCTKVGAVTLRVPEGVEIVSRTDTLELVLPSGQLLPIQTRYTMDGETLQVSGAHTFGRSRMKHHLVFQDRNGEGMISLRRYVTSTELDSTTLPMDPSWTSVDDVQAACAAADWTGAAVVEVEVPDLTEEEPLGEPFTPAPPKPISNCAGACAKVDTCGTFPSEYGETLDACIQSCEDGLIDSPEVVEAVFACLDAAACDAAAIDACADGDGQEEVR